MSTVAERLRFLCDLARGRAQLDSERLDAFFGALAADRVTAQELVFFLSTLQALAPDPATIAAFVRAVWRLHPTRALHGAEAALNIVGTGGGASTFNISTAAALVAAAAGAKVLKSGSRSYTSGCGALDVLRALGMPLPAQPNELSELLERFNIAFVSEAHYPALFAQLARRMFPVGFTEVGGFINRVGPLLCPYRVAGQVIGVSSQALFDAYAALPDQLALPRSILVHSRAGVDELTSCAPNQYCVLGAAVPALGSLDPDTYGFATAALSELSGGTPAHNAQVLLGVCAGTIRGPRRDTVLLNAALLLVLAGKAQNMGCAIRLAATVIDAGAVHELIARLRAHRSRGVEHVAAPHA